MTETVGFIGLGLMGRPMAKNLLAKGLLACRAQSQPGAGGRPGCRGGRARCVTR